MRHSDGVALLLSARTLVGIHFSALFKMVESCINIDISLHNSTSYTASI